MSYGLSVTCEVALLDKRLGSAALRKREDTEAKAVSEYTAFVCDVQTRRGLWLATRGEKKCSFISLQRSVHWA